MESAGNAKPGADASVARLLIVAMLLLPFVLLPVLMLPPYLVTLRAAWTKPNRHIWRTAVVASILVAMLVAVACSPWLIPAGFPFPLESGDPYSNLSGVIYWTMAGINAQAIAGVALLPLAFASTLHTVVTRKHEK